MFKILLLFLTTLSFAQNSEQILSDKLRPFIFQAEKQISEQLKLTIEEQIRLKEISVSTTLDIDTDRIAKNARLIINKHRFSLPGLDESVSIVEENIRNYEPKIQDIFYGIKSISVSLSTSKELTLEEKTRIQESIEENLKSLQLSNISYEYKVQLASPTPTQSIESAPSISWYDFRWPIVSLVLLFIGIGLTFYLITLKLGINKLETMTKSLAQAVSSIEIKLPPSTERRNENLIKESSSLTPLKVLSLDEVKNQIRQLIDKNQSQQEELLKEFFNMGSPAKNFILLDCIPEEERIHYHSLMGQLEKEEYFQFLSRMASGEIQEEILVSEAITLHREMNLYFHNPELIKKQVLKNKIATLDRLSLAHLIESSDAREFSVLTQLASPIELSLVLTSYPQLLSQFDTLPKAVLSSDELKLFQKKVEAVASQQKLSYNEEVNLSEYLPLDIEKDFNLKQGKRKTLWQELDDTQNQNLIDFALDLTAEELSYFMAILPQENQSRIIEKLPELKNLQLKRLGFRLNEKSIELKHSFFQQLKQQIWS